MDGSLAADGENVVRHTLDQLGLQGILLRARTVIVDDFDRLDDASQVLLTDLLEQPAARSLRLIAAIAHPPLSERFDGVARLQLEPLDDDDMRRVARVIGGAPIDPATCDLLIARASGNPGVLAAAAQRLTTAQRAGGAPLPLPLPAAYPEEATRIRARFALLDQEWEALQRISTAPAVSVAAVPVLLGVPSDRIESLIARGLVAREGGRLSIPIAELRSELYWGMSDDERANAHAAAAEAELPADRDLHEWHASHLVKDAHTAPALYAAASALLHRGSTAVALEIAERALGMAASGQPVHQQLDFTRALLFHDRPREARRHLVDDRAPMTRRQMVQRASLDVLIRAVSNEELRLDAVDALVSRFRTELPDACAELLALAGVLLVVDGATDEGLWRIEAAAALGTALPPASSLLYWACRVAQALRGGLRRPTNTITAALPDEMSPEVRFTAAIALTWEERTAEAREQLAVVMSTWRGARSPWAGRALALAVHNEIRGGDLVHGAELAQRIQRPDVAGTPFETMSLAWLALAHGRDDDADALLRATDRPPATYQRFSTLARDRIRAVGALLHGSPDVAADLLRRVVDGAPDLSAGVFRAHPDLVEALWRLGDRTAARAVVDRLEQTLAVAPSRWAELALLRCRALLSEDIDAAFMSALEASRPGELPFDRARTHAWYALAADRAAMSERAAEERQIAIEQFARLGATAWMQHFGAPAGAAAAPASLLPLLSDTETAVLRMIRSGTRNRDIAAALYMSLRSVELRLTSIYRKFGVTSRSGLLAVLPADWQ